MTLREKQNFRRAFFRKAGHNADMFRMAMDCVPGVAFNMKDAEGRIVALNRYNCDICNIHDEMDAVGKTSAEIFPPMLAQDYMNKDRAVRQRDAPSLKDVQPYPADRSAREMLASRFPLHDARGRLIGTACVYYLRPLAASFYVEGIPRFGISAVNARFSRDGCGGGARRSSGRSRRCRRGRRDAACRTRG